MHRLTIALHNTFLYYPTALEETEFQLRPSNCRTLPPPSITPTFRLPTVHIDQKNSENQNHGALNNNRLLSICTIQVYVVRTVHSATKYDRLRLGRHIIVFVMRLQLFNEIYTAQLPIFAVNTHLAAGNMYICAKQAVVVGMYSFVQTYLAMLNLIHSV